MQSSFWYMEGLIPDIADTAWMLLECKDKDVRNIGDVEGYVYSWDLFTCSAHKEIIAMGRLWCTLATVAFRLAQRNDISPAPYEDKETLAEGEMEGYQREWMRKRGLLKEKIASDQSPVSDAFKPPYLPFPLFRYRGMSNNKRYLKLCAQLLPLLQACHDGLTINLLDLTDESYTDLVEDDDINIRHISRSAKALADAIAVLEAVG